MSNRYNEIAQKVLNIKPYEFNEICAEIFQYQVKENEIYKRWVSLVRPHTPDPYPFLPIAQFKKNKIASSNFVAEKIFESSSTTGKGLSHHHVKSLEFYRKYSQQRFEEKLGDINQYHFMALLPGYLESGQSSLVHMAEEFMKLSENSGGFYLNDYKRLIDTVNSFKDKRVILIGVSHALLDLGEKHPNCFQHPPIIMETGGMKGKRKELTKAELHEKLKSYFGVQNIESEYGMTELLGQFYSKKDGIFEENNTMRVVITDINDPYKVLAPGKRGRINIIDLGNIHSCSFIATEDLGLKQGGNTFQVIGRISNSEARGCNQIFE
jgi:hypothetical protein